MRRKTVGTGPRKLQNPRSTIRRNPWPQADGCDAVRFMNANKQEKERKERNDWLEGYIGFGQGGLLFAWVNYIKRLKKFLKRKCGSDNDRE